MIKNYIYNGKIDEDFTNFVAASLNENADNKYTICFIVSSDGGFTDDKDVALFMLNCARSHRGITLVAKNEILSAAFDLFLGFDGEIEVLPNTIGMTHLSSFVQTVTSTGVVYEPKYLKAVLDRRNTLVGICDIENVDYIEEDQIADYFNGEPIYLDTDQLKSAITASRIKRGLS